MFLFERRFVQQKPRLEIIGAVENHVAAVAQPEDVARFNVGDDRLDFDRAVDLSQFLRRRHGFGECRGDIGLVVQHLPLQIVQLQEIAIDDSQLADTGPRKGVGNHTSQRAAAADERTAGSQSTLPFFAYGRISHLPGITGEGIHFASRFQIIFRAVPQIEW